MTTPVESDRATRSVAHLSESTQHLVRLAGGFCEYGCPMNWVAVGERSWCLACRMPVLGGFGGGVSRVSAFAGDCPTPGCGHAVSCHRGDGCQLQSMPAAVAGEPAPVATRCSCRRMPTEAKLAVERSKWTCCSPNPLSPRLLCELPKHPPEIDHAAMVEQTEVGHDDARVVRWRG